MSRRLSAILALVLVATTAFPATLDGPIPPPLPLFPANNWWNVDVTNAPAVADSTIYHARMGGATRRMHPDWGATSFDPPCATYGIPYITVDGSQAKKVVDFVEFGNESDGEGQAFYPIPDEAITTLGWTECGHPANEDYRPESDRHMLIVDTTNNDLYELYDVFHNGTNWEASSGAFFDMDTNNRRPEGWTSADAAGLAILPGLVRYDELFGPDEIRHAFRVTFSSTNGHVFPASHTAGSTSGALPMGARLRLRADYPETGPAHIQKFIRALKKYGLIVADNGSNLYVQGTYDSRWDNDVLNQYIDDIRVSDFQIIQLGWKPTFSPVLTLPTSAGRGDAVTGTLTIYDQNFNVATGFTGTVQFTSTDGSATLPSSYTFTAGDAGTHTFPAGFTFQTSGSQIVTVRDTVTPTITGSRGIAIGPPTPANFVATAIGTTQVNTSWTASAGATQYELLRNNVLLTTTAATSFPDTTAAPGTSYVYKVRALDASSRASSYSTPDVATTILFSDDPVVAGNHVKALHLTQLRVAANSIRAAAGLGAMSFTNDPLNGVAIKAVHVQELRTGINAARTALGMAASAFTDPALTQFVSTSRAVHVQELRTAVK
jgi:hypothetical protein